MRLLATTSLTKLWNGSENIIFLGEWCKTFETRKKWLDKDYLTLCHHWTNKEKLYRDYKYLTNLNDKIISYLTKKLNIYHNINYNEKCWRVIIGAWMPMYLSSMFDRWESLRIFFDKYNDSQFTYDFNIQGNIFYNYGFTDYVDKVVSNDFWNHKNFIRIINYKYKKKIKIKLINYNETTPKITNEKNNLKKNKISEIIKKIIFKFDDLLSFIGIRINPIIIENFYHSRKNLMQIFLRSRIFPAFYTNTFSEKKFKTEKIKNINLDDRKNLFSSIESKNEFENYLFKCIITDFPISYFEKFKEIKISNQKFTKSKKEKIFTKTSYISNERFKIWLAEMMHNGSKLYIGKHGGCFQSELNGSLGLTSIVADKILTWNATRETNEMQLSPIELFKVQKTKNKKKKENLLIVNAETARYPCKIQSHPFAEEYKINFNELCHLIRNLSPNIRQNIIYRSNNLGYNTSAQLNNLFSNLSTKNYENSTLIDNINRSKLAICTYPETAISELIIADIPTVIFFSRDLYQLNKDSNKVLDDLKKAKVYFEDKEQISEHINKIWDNPLEWWKSNQTTTSINELKKFAFHLRNNWLDEWSSFIKS
tara:strand:- start:33098 stop:34882 length:1785 start_codon:yes stop_codon:yes gene_type:complete